jgi:hypothetical protein
MGLYNYPISEFLLTEPRDELYRAIACLVTVGVRLTPWNGPWIAGGCLLRAKALGVWSRDSDIDVFVRKDDLVTLGLIQDLVEDGHITQRHRTVVGMIKNLLGTSDRPSFVREVYDFKYRGFAFQFIVVSETSLPGLLAGFDLHLSMIGTDGQTIIVDEKCMSNLQDKRITCNLWNEGTEGRVTKFARLLPEFKPDRRPQPPVNRWSGGY